ncbi:hypothetical protein Tsubulata_003187 [Turnera subulata]|uniref:Hydrophobic seed protein domain-containing protein n=1 Tax=Turnera subulata TaxID=218843 RepID=A0A9Q0JGL6_9ROSI|nr:hypothetical protein Tsubulata_003187 [Turnera subulata]
MMCLLGVLCLACIVNLGLCLKGARYSMKCPTGTPSFGQP